LELAPTGVAVDFDETEEILEEGPVEADSA
jgi:hypothetical protein